MKVYKLFKSMYTVGNESFKVVDADVFVKEFFLKDKARNFVKDVYEECKTSIEYGSVSDLEEICPIDSETLIYLWSGISTISNVQCVYRYVIECITKDETEEKEDKIMEQEKYCMYCDPDKYGRQPISYNTTYVGGHPLFTTGVFIHLENKRPELSSYVLNAEYNTICDDRIVIEYCPCCGRKLRKD